MILLDTNVFIYLANGTIDFDTIKQDIIGFASITKIEALGYSQINVAEQQYLEALFSECEQLNLAESVIRTAIKLRQRTNMKLGDAIIAATALEYDCELYTANEKIFLTLKVYIFIILYLISKHSQKSCVNAPKARDRTYRLAFGSLEANLIILQYSKLFFRS